jgi:aarF domain-containing kinase
MAEWHNVIVIPRPYLQYCSKHVLVMEYLQGKKLVDGIREQFAEVAALSGRTLEEIEAERKEAIENGTFIFKSIQESHQESIQMQRMLWLKDATNPINLQRGLYNWTVGWFFPPRSYQRTKVPIDLGHVIDLLCRIHASQIFKNGEFNGDPHPGNFMLLTDGRIGLIDFGQLKEMSLSRRISFAKLILAHARNDKAEIIRLHFDPNEIGTISKFKKEEMGYLLSTVQVDRMTKEVMGDKNIVELLDWIEAQDPMVKQAEEFLFAYHVSILLRGMGNAFGIQLRMSKQWEAEAKAFLKSQNVEY